MPQPRALILSALLAATAALPAAAQDFFGRTPGDILNVARSFGPAEFDSPDADGRPVIAAETDDGILYGVLMYGCESYGPCESAQLFASFEPTAETDVGFANAWNLDRRYGTAYIADDGAVVISMSVNLDFGVTSQNFFDTFDIWDILLGDFTDLVYPPDPGAGAPRETK